MFTLTMMLPLFSFTMLLLFGSKLGQSGANMFSCLMMFGAVICSLLLFYDLGVTGSITYLSYWSWMDFSLFNANLSFFVDTISGTMILVVNMVSFLVHLYSTSYMSGDPHTMSFMAYLSMFTFFMLMLVSSQNYLQLFIGWEGVGLCSYLLVNFWYSSIQANKAAIKAMLVNSVGDACLMAGMIIIWFNFGSVNFIAALPLGGEVATFMMPFLLLLGAVGKSAQIGLHTWLPDAMEGPTPVSALMHAATMVTAGVYLIMSSSAFFEASSLALIITTVIGSTTALFAATVGLAQNDMKKIMAYSTCSQLGFMVLSCGLSYYSLALFHLVNHAFFKALLFLSAGSIIHGLLDEQDLSKMGGALLTQPLSYVLMLMGSMALAGFPFLSGYYSKDLLLELSSQEYFMMFGCWMGLSATMLTALYSFKLLFSAFMSYSNSPRSVSSQNNESDWLLLGPLVILALGSLFSGFMLNTPILGSVIHPMLGLSLKLSPLMLSLLGGFLGLLLYFITSSTWSIFFLLGLNKGYQFLSAAWDFDKTMNNFIVYPSLKFGYNVSFKTFDTGFLEKLGPQGLSKEVMYITKKITQVQSGYLFNYAVLIILFLTLFIVFS